MTEPQDEHPPGVFNGQPVMQGHHGRLVYDCQPESADGCVLPVPSDFLGMPHLTPQLDSAQIEAEAR